VRRQDATAGTLLCARLGYPQRSSFVKQDVGELIGRLCALPFTKFNLLVFR